MVSFGVVRLMLTPPPPEPSSSSSSFSAAPPSEPNKDEEGASVTAPLAAVEGSRPSSNSARNDGSDAGIGLGLLRTGAVRWGGEKVGGVPSPPDPDPEPDENGGTKIEGMVVSGLNLEAAELDLERPRVGRARGGDGFRGDIDGGGDCCRPEVATLEDPLEEAEEDRWEEEEATLDEARDDED